VIFSGVGCGGYKKERCKERLCENHSVIIGGCCRHPEKVYVFIFHIFMIFIFVFFMFIIFMCRRFVYVRSVNYNFKKANAVRAVGGQSGPSQFVSVCVVHQF